MRLCGFSHPLERWYNPFVSFIIKGKKFFATMRQKARRSVLRNITFFEVHIEKRPRYYRSNVRIVARFCMYTLANVTKRGVLHARNIAGYCSPAFTGTFYSGVEALPDYPVFRALRLRQNHIGKKTARTFSGLRAQRGGVRFFSRANPRKLRGAFG